MRNLVLEHEAARRNTMPVFVLGAKDGMSELSDTTTIVVGASRGLGRGIATALAEAGAHPRGLKRSPEASIGPSGSVARSGWPRSPPPSCSCVEKENDHGGFENERRHDTRGQDSADYRCEPRHRRSAGRRGAPAWCVARLCRDASADSPR